MRFSKQAATGTYYVSVFDLGANKIFDWSTNTWVVLGSVTTPGVAMTPDSIGVQSIYWAVLNLSTLAGATTPRDLAIVMYLQAGGAPAPSTDTAQNVWYQRSACGYAVPADPASCPFVVDITAVMNNTSGTSMNFTVELMNDGITIPLNSLDTGATCSIVLTQDASTTGGARVAVFTLSTAAIAATNASSRFEVTVPSPGLASNAGFTAVATIVTGGITYTGECKFTTF